MSIEDTFNGAKSAFMVYQSLFSEVAEELGQERALALNAKATERAASETGKMIKEQMDVEEMGIMDAAALVRSSIEQTFGIASEVIEEGENRIVFRLHRCSVHEAARDTGMDAEATEAQCRTGAVAYMSAVLKELNPRLGYELVQCRTSPDGFCEEAVTLT